MSACTLGKRHKWAFVKNITVMTKNGNTARISQRGAYRCECGATKNGESVYAPQQKESGDE